MLAPTSPKKPRSWPAKKVKSRSISWRCSASIFVFSGICSMPANTPPTAGRGRSGHLAHAVRPPDAAGAFVRHHAGADRMCAACRPCRRGGIRWDRSCPSTTWAQSQPGGISPARRAAGVRCRSGKRRRASCAAYAGLQGEARSAGSTPMPRQLASTTSMRLVEHGALRRGVAARSHHLRIAVVEERAALRASGAAPSRWPPAGSRA